MNKLVSVLPALRVFRKVGYSRSFSEAAHFLNVTQSAVSHQIRKLESLLGVGLFDRTATGVTLTKEGEYYLQEIDEALRIIEEATYNITKGERPDKIIVNSLPSFGALWLMPRLSQFNYQYPNTTIILQNSIEMIDFMSDEINVGIRVGEVPGHSYADTGARIDLKLVRSWDDVDCQYLTDDVLVPIIAKTHAEITKFQKPDDILQFPLIHNGSRPYAWEDWGRLYGVATGRDVGEIYGHFFMALEACRQGRGVALLPDILLSVAEKRDFYCMRDYTIRGRGDYVLLTRRNERHRDSIIQFKNWLLHVLETERSS